MPIKKSAKKALRQTKKRTERNKSVKANIEWLKHQFLKSISAKDKEKSQEFYAKLQKFLDKAAQKGVLKKNTASRNKSRLTKKLNLLK